MNATSRCGSAQWSRGERRSGDARLDVERLDALLPVRDELRPDKSSIRLTCEAFVCACVCVEVLNAVDSCVCVEACVCVEVLNAVERGRGEG